jgi:hypothetical protein
LSPGRYSRHQLASEVLHHIADRVAAAF